MHLARTSSRVADQKLQNVRLHMYSGVVTIVMQMLLLVTVTSNLAWSSVITLASPIGSTRHHPEPGASCTRPQFLSNPQSDVCAPRVALRLLYFYSLYAVVVMSTINLPLNNRK